METGEWIALAAAIPGLITVIMSVARTAGARWRRVRDAERAGRLQVEAELLASQKREAILEVKLKYCEGELETRATADSGG